MSTEKSRDAAAVQNQAFGNAQPLSNGSSVFANERISQDVDLVTARVNYKFGGPVVADPRKLRQALLNLVPGTTPMTLAARRRSVGSQRRCLVTPKTALAG